VADVLLAFSKCLILVRPLSRERSIIQGLTRARLVVMVQVQRNETIGMLLSEDDEEVQVLDLNHTSVFNAS